MATISPSVIQILILASTNLRLKTQSCCKYFFNSFRIYWIETGEITVPRTKPGLLVFITYEQVLTSGTLAFCCKVVIMSVIGRLLLVHCIVRFIIFFFQKGLSKTCLNRGAPSRITCLAVISSNPTVPGGWRRGGTLGISG